MEMQINIKNIKINSISTLGSLNVGKVMFLDNKTTSTKAPKEHYEESEMDEQQLKKLLPAPVKPPSNHKLNHKNVSKLTKNEE